MLSVFATKYTVLIYVFHLLFNLFDIRNLPLYNAQPMTSKSSLDISDRPLGARMTGTYQSIDPSQMGQSPFGSTYGSPEKGAPSCL